MTQTLQFPLALRQSYKLRDISPGLELWQIGEDRLGEYTALFSRIYDEHFKYHLERNRTGEEILEVYRGFLTRAVYMGVLKEGAIATTGTALLAYSKDLPPALPDDAAPVFDLPAMADEFQAPAIWFVSRMAMDKKLVTSRESPLIFAEIGRTTTETVGGHPRNLMIGLMEKKLLRFYRRYGIHWNTLDEVELPFGDGFRMFRAWVRAGELG